MGLTKSHDFLKSGSGGQRQEKSEGQSKGGISQGRTSLLWALEMVGTTCQPPGTDSQQGNGGLTELRGGFSPGTSSKELSLPCSMRP